MVMHLKSESTTNEGPRKDFYFFWENRKKLLGKKLLVT